MVSCPAAAVVDQGTALERILCKVLSVHMQWHCMLVGLNYGIKRFVLLICIAVFGFNLF